MLLTMAYFSASTSTPKPFLLVFALFLHFLASWMLPIERHFCAIGRSISSTSGSRLMSRDAELPLLGLVLHFRTLSYKIETQNGRKKELCYTPSSNCYRCLQCFVAAIAWCQTTHTTPKKNENAYFTVIYSVLSRPKHVARNLYIELRAIFAGICGVFFASSLPTMAHVWARTELQIWNSGPAPPPWRVALTFYN